jgi:nucleoside-diphosphate-sugar epimerase
MLGNTIGVAELLRYSHENSVKSFLFISSIEVYGKVDASLLCIGENDYGIVDPIDPRSCYAEGKRAGEAMVVAWHNQYATPVKIVRPCVIYGPGMSIGDGRAFGDFVSAIISKKDIVMTSEGRARRSFCYIADAIVAFLEVMLLGENGCAYNVANPDSDMSIRDLAELFVSLYPEMGLSVKIDIPKCNYLPSKFIQLPPADIERVMLLGWEPHISIQEGIRKTVVSFCDD